MTPEFFTNVDGSVFYRHKGNISNELNKKVSDLFAIMYGGKGIFLQNKPEKKVTSYSTLDENFLDLSYFLSLKPITGKFEEDISGLKIPKGGTFFASLFTWININTKALFRIGASPGVAHNKKLEFPVIVKYNYFIEFDHEGRFLKFDKCSGQTLNEFEFLGKIRVNLVNTTYRRNISIMSFDLPKCANIIKKSPEIILEGCCKRNRDFLSGLEFLGVSVVEDRIKFA